MARSLQLLVALAAAAVNAAESSTVVSLLLLDADPQPLVASAVGADSTATTYVFGCPPGTDSNDCGFSPSQTITQGPSTVQMTYSRSNDEYGLLTRSLNCELDSKRDQARCTEDVSSSGPDTEFHSTTTNNVEYLSAMLQVTVTAGLEKMSGGVIAPSTSGPTATPTGDKTQSTGGAAESSEGGSSQSTTTSPNAAPAITQQAFVAGVAAVVGVMAL